MTIDYHGQEYKEGISPKSVPPMPETAQEQVAAAAADMLDTASKRYCPPHGIWPSVLIEGKYGVGCMSFQSLRFQRVTEGQVSELAWTYFGLCSKSIKYFDENGVCQKRG